MAVSCHYLFLPMSHCDRCGRVRKNQWNGCIADFVNFVPTEGRRSNIYNDSNVATVSHFNNVLIVSYRETPWKITGEIIL